MNPVIVRNVKIGEGVPKICVPIVGVTKEEIINEAKTFENILTVPAAKKVCLGAQIRAIFRGIQHILAEYPICKGGNEMTRRETAGGGDVDDLIFQDSWTTSQR